MGYLGNDFIISSMVLIIVLFTILYIYRKKVFAFYYVESDFEKFIRLVKEYLIKNYPKIKFNYNIISQSKNENNPQARCYEVIDHLVDDFINSEIDTTVTPKPVPLKLLWDSYTFDALPVGTKLPKDWAKRKAVAIQRDHNICQRCGYKTKPETAHLFLLKSIKQGGQFYLENMIIICKDCQRVTTKKDLKYLNIKDELTNFIK